MRLTEFRQTLQILDSLLDSKVSLFEHCKKDFQSQRLRNLVTFKNIEKPENHVDDEENAEELRF